MSSSRGYKLVPNKVNDNDTLYTQKKHQLDENNRKQSVCWYELSLLRAEAEKLSWELSRIPVEVNRKVIPYRSDVRATCIVCGEKTYNRIRSHAECQKHSVKMEQEFMDITKELLEKR